MFHSMSIKISTHILPKLLVHFFFYYKQLLSVSLFNPTSREIPIWYYCGTTNAFFRGLAFFSCAPPTESRFLLSLHRSICVRSSRSSITCFHEPANILHYSRLIRSISNSSLQDIRWFVGTTNHQVKPFKFFCIANYVRLYSGLQKKSLEGFLEIMFTIGVLPGATEVVSRFTTNVRSNGTIIPVSHVGPAIPKLLFFLSNTLGILFTDDNGYEYLPRSFDFSHSIGGSYFPMIYSSYIQDPTSLFALYSERTHGASSLVPGAFLTHFVAL